MRAFEVLSEEHARIDKFLLRTMGEASPENKLYFAYFNPSLVPWEFRAGMVFKVPESTDIDGILSLRMLFIIAMER